MIPPFETFYDEPLRRGPALPGRRLGGQRGRGRVPGDVPPRPARLRRLEHGEHLRAWVLTIAAGSPSTTSAGAGRRSELPETSGTRTAAGVRGARAADGRPPPEGARGRRAPLRLRPRLRRDRRRARLDRGRGPAGRVRRRAPAQEGGRHDTSPPCSTSASAPRRPPSGLLDAAYDVVDTPVGALLVGVTDRGVCRIYFDPDPEPSSSGSRGVRPARAALAASRSTRCAGSSTSTSRARASDFDLALDLRGCREYNRARARASSRACRTARRRRTARWRRTPATRGRRARSGR